VPGDEGDLGFGASDNGKARHGGTAQIVEGDADNASLARGDAPRRLKAMRSPRTLEAINENKRAVLRGRVECSLQRRANRDDDACAGLALLESDVRAVIANNRCRAAFDA
jgi:hypothetical protein